MQKLPLLITLVFILFTIACAPKVRTNVSHSYASLDYREDVIVMEIADSIPASAEVLGTVKVGDAGMSSQCNYMQVLEKAKEEARKAGGNVVKITEHKNPDFMSSCHRITAQIIRLDASQVALMKANDNDIDPTLDYAMLYVYRKGGTGPLVSYNLNLGDSVICRVTNRFKQGIKIYKQGALELWAKTESRSSLPINIEKGKTYYVRCSVSTGIMVGRPSLELLSKHAGSQEYETIKTKNK